MRTYNGGIILVIFLWMTSSLCEARPLEEAPLNIQAALLVKLLALNQNVNRGGDLVIYVVGAPKFAQTMKPAIGRNIGKSKLANVEELDHVPEAAPSGPAVLYVGQLEPLESCLAYCKKNQILSITGIPDLMDKGITMRIGVEHKKPAVLLSTTLSTQEGIQWDSKVFAIASDE